MVLCCPKGRLVRHKLYYKKYRARNECPQILGSEICTCRAWVAKPYFYLLNIFANWQYLNLREPTLNSPSRHSNSIHIFRWYSSLQPSLIPFLPHHPAPVPRKSILLGNIPQPLPFPGLVCPSSFLTSCCLENSLILEAWLEQHGNKEMTDTYTEKQGSGGRCLLWWGAPTTLHSRNVWTNTPTWTRERLCHLHGSEVLGSLP